MNISQDNIQLVYDTIQVFDTIQVYDTITQIKTVSVTDTTHVVIPQIIEVKSMMEKVTDLVVPILTVLIASFALFFGIRSNRKMQSHNELSLDKIHNHNKLSVKPLIILDAYYSRVTYTFELKLINTGLGPAFIDYTKIIFNNKENNTYEEIIKTIFNIAAKQISPNIDSNFKYDKSVHTIDPCDKYVLPVNESILFYRIKLPKSLPEEYIFEIFKIISSTSIKYRFKGFYDSNYKINNQKVPQFEDIFS